MAHNTYPKVGRFVVRTAVAALALALTALSSTASAGTDEPPCPVAPSCASLPNAPAAMLERLTPNDHVLFYGDSITKRNEDTTFHYGKLLDHVLRRTYREYCETPIVFTLDGVEGRKPYAQNRSKRISQNIEKGVPPYDWVFVQDSGAPTAPDHYAAEVALSISLSLEVSPPVEIILATTPPLDEAETLAGNCRRYVRACNWAASNEIIESFVSETANARLSALPLNNDACQIQRLSSLTVTNDGIHLASVGSLVYALSLYRFFGGDLGAISDCAFTKNDGFPFDDNLDDLSGARVRDVLIEERDGECRMVPSCYNNFVAEADECIAHCAADGNDCVPYFAVDGACCGNQGCLDFVDASVCSSTFSGSWSGSGSVCTPNCCDSDTCNTIATTTTTTTTLDGPRRGACCFSGACTDDVADVDCAGTFKGNTSQCTPTCCEGGLCLVTTTTSTTLSTTTTTSSSSTTTTTTSTTSTTSTTTSTTEPPCGATDWRWEGDEAAAYAGTSVALIGDLDSDGRPEVAVGVPNSDRDHRSGGGVIVLDGDGNELLRIPGFEEGARSGESVSAMGDGHRLLVGSPGAGLFPNEGAGRVEIWDLADGAVLVAALDGTESHTALGASLAAFGDGRRFVAGSPDAGGRAGRVGIYEAVDDTVVELAVFEGALPGDRLGAAVAAFGDGILFAAGSPGADGPAGPQTGKAAIYSIIGGSGRPPIITVTGDAAGSRFGSAVAAARETWLVGAPGSESREGQVWVLGLRNPDPSIPSAVVSASEPNAGFGLSVVTLNRDVTRFAVGAPNATSIGGARSGRVEVFSLNDGSTNVELAINNHRFSDRAGTSLATVTSEDLLVGIPGADGLAVDAAGLKHRVRGGGAVELRRVCP
ncbi:MAG: hypothetical protein ACI8TX_000046 [Hyphomicrobiaceae bacterium]